VWLAELAAVTDGSEIAAVVASALGLPDRGGLEPASAVVRALAGQDVLLVLDNCEHVVDGAAKFCDQVIRHCPRTRIVATSREPLGIDGEQVYRVPSMSLPERGADTPDDLAGSDAVSLFLARGNLSLDDASAPLVATICRRLDGIPLALELAAARLSSMSLKQISERLDQRFRLLTGGSRNAMPRQQTLQAAVEWSFGLLTAAERDTLLRLSVFAGGFELEAAEEICVTETVDAFDVADLLGSLVDKSLVVADRPGDSVRYRLLETIRQYGAEGLLRAAGEAEVLRVHGQHAAFYLRLAEASVPGLRGREQGGWFRRLDAEWDNLRAALSYYEAEKRTADVLRLGVALARYAVSRAQGGVLTVLRAAVQQPQEPGIELARGLLAVLFMTQFFDRPQLGRLSAGKPQAERALAIARSAGDIECEVNALCLLCGLAYLDGAPPQEQERLGTQAVSLARHSGGPHLLGSALGTVAITAGPEQARSMRLEALDCFRQCGDDLLAATELHMLYGLEIHAGSVADGQGHLEEAVALAEAVGDEMFLYFFSSDLALLRLMQERHADAAPIVRRLLRTARRTAVAAGAAEVLLTAACCTAWQGELARAATLHGCADVAISAGLENRTMRWSDAEQALREREQARVRGQLGETGWLAAYQTGQRLAPATAIELALGRDTAPGGPPVSSVS
jgi:non-specific serine/threonine protein kinase